MPFYQITVLIQDKKRPATGIRESTISDVDAAWRYYKLKAEKASPGKVKEFNLVMLSKLSEEVKKYLENSHRPPADGLPE